MSSVATSLIINNDGKLLILKRSDKVKTYKGFWGGVAGYIEKNEKPIETAYKEIKEEVGFEKEYLTLKKRLDPIKIIDYYDNKRYAWEIFVFLFELSKKRNIKIDWEHSEYKWIRPSEIINYKTVPHLKEIVKKIIL
jgi:8-oxo-dGTP pyrophosphatase MutT (NUDIX family)